ncbi:hypothetical protein ASE75_05360 [Sphingomonas sp. Leaf17]|uniref:hypothetical protein n=1 Tax=Sphingomonas sp. Leaf17 TaxID=1735683 RepID=UPI0006F56131|nr:hypothetical protein [Sphingomonas sp. Leaf17]KQM65669.1 hypothetical protein ASE75_05360 [Sphingomonas sp. Leaf17]
MTTDPNFYLTMAAAALVAIAMLSATVLSGWRGWLSLKRCEMEAAGEPNPAGAPAVGARIEIADLKERIKKLEAIAAGVDL